MAKRKKYAPPTTPSEFFWGENSPKFSHFLSIGHSRHFAFLITMKDADSEEPVQLSLDKRDIRKLVNFLNERLKVTWDDKGDERVVVDEEE